MMTIARSVQSKDPSNSSLGNNHDSSLDVTGRQVRVDTAIDDELYRIQISKMISIIRSTAAAEMYIPGCPCHRPWC